MLNRFFKEDGILASFADYYIVILILFQHLLDMFTGDSSVVEFFYILLIVSDFFQFIS